MTIVNCKTPLEKLLQICHITIKTVQTIQQNLYLEKLTQITNKKKHTVDDDEGVFEALMTLILLSFLDLNESCIVIGNNLYVSLTAVHWVAFLLCVKLHATFYC